MSAHRNDIFCGGVWISRADAQRVFIDEAPKVSDEQAQAAWDAPHTNAEQVDGVGGEDERLAQSALTELGVYDTPSSNRVDRELAADYYILVRYDRAREVAGHDYGSGQRSAELMRRRCKLGITIVDFDELERDFAFTASELHDAYVRVGLPRLERVLREDYRRWTPATGRTVRTWERLQAAIERSQFS